MPTPEPTPDLILGFLSGTLAPDEASALASSIAADPALHRRVERLRSAVEVLRADALDPVPGATFAAAISLGDRLPRALTIGDQLLDVFARASAAVRAVIAEVSFDSRVTGALAGLRGGSGFALALAAEGVEIDLECEPTEGSRILVVGQVTTSVARGPHRPHRIESLVAAEDGLRSAGRCDIDDEGMFRLSLEPGRHLLRFLPADGSPGGPPPIDAGPIDLP